jgi:hypothetical protein
MIYMLINEILKFKDISLAWCGSMHLYSQLYQKQRSGGSWSKPNKKLVRPHHSKQAKYGSTFVFPATQEAEVGGSPFKAPGKKHESLSEKIIITKKKKKRVGHWSNGRNLPSKYKALASNPSTAKNK